GGRAHRGPRPATPAATAAGRAGDGGELHAVVVPAAHVLACHAATSGRAVVARRSGRAAAPATDGIANGLAEVAPAAKFSGLLLRVDDAATPGPAGVKVSLCDHVSLLCLRGRLPGDPPSFGVAL